MTIQSFKTPRQIIMETFREVVEAVAKENRVTVADMLSDSHFREHTSARRKAVKRMRERMPKLTLVRIGELFNRDHTAVSELLQNTARSRKSPPKPEQDTKVETEQCACGCGLFRLKVKGRRYINGHQPNFSTHPNMAKKQNA